MSGISGSGLISGIDTASLVDQLIQASSRPRILAEQRLAQLQTQQAAILDINSRLNSLGTAAASFRVDSLFESKLASSSNEDVLRATAGNTASIGGSTFVVDRLVTSQQLLTKGFADRDSSAFGASSFTFESSGGRLDRDVALDSLNDGQGITRGNISLTGSSGTATVDLSRVATVNDVLDAINGSGTGVTASISESGFTLSGVLSATNSGTRDVLSSLGFASALTVTTPGVPEDFSGSSVYSLSTETALSELNDGRGVVIASRNGERVFDFTLNVTGPGGTQAVNVRLGELFDNPDDAAEVTTAAVNSLGGVVDRINTALTDAGFAASDISASIGADGIQFTVGAGVNLDSVEDRSDANTTTAADLGIVNLAGTGTLTGTRILAGLQTKLTSSLFGASGISGDGNLDFTDRDGNTFSADISSAQTVTALLETINTAASGAGSTIVASLNEAGTGIQIRDTGTGTSNLIVTGTGGNDTAEALGISTGASGVASSLIKGTSAQAAYYGLATKLTDIDANIGTGSFTIRDSSGVISTIEINADDTELRDVIDAINNASADVTARINDNGDGILIENNATGSLALEIEDQSGSIASALRIAGTGDTTGSNNIDGTFETTVTFDAADTLDDAISKINSAGAGVSVSVINNGLGSKPFRLSISATDPGREGRFTIDTGSFDLGLQTLAEGEDARVFFGSSDPATGVLLTSSSNTLDNALGGVTIDLVAASDEPITLSVSQDTQRLEEQVTSFIDAFNTVLDRIDSQTRFVEETNERGPLLGDGQTISLRATLFNAVTGTNDGFTSGFERLTDVGIRITTGGKLELDAERFRAALDANPTAVEDLFTRRTIDSNNTTVDLGNGVTANDPNGRTTFSELGVIPALEELIDSYTDTVDGTLTRRNETLDSQIDLQQDRIGSLQEQLDAERLKLETEFAIMEQTLASLQQQQAALGSLSAAG